VYLARHLRLERKVALKVLDPQLAADERFRERFLRESRLAADMNHPNIVPVYDADQVGEVLFLAMRYVEGTDLGSLLGESGRFAPARAIDIVSQVASALDAAHARGLIHRDVKPANILIASGAGGEAAGHTYLTDFGLAKRPGSAAGLTKSGQFLGSIEYAAPEQFEGKSLTPRTDVYSLGCVLFECLTAEPPFVREQEAAVMYAHLSEAPPRGSAINPDVSAEMDRVVVRAMAKRPEDRYASAGDLATAAREALPRTLPSPPGPPRRRSTVPLVAAIVAIAVLAAGLVLFLTRGSPTTVLARESTNASRPAVVPTKPSTAKLSAGVIRIDPERATVLARIPTAVGGVVHAIYRSLAVTRSAIWYGPSGAKINPAQNTVVGTALLPPLSQTIAGDTDTDTVWSFRGTATGLTRTGEGILVGVDARTNLKTLDIRIPDLTSCCVTGLVVGSGSVWAVAQEREGHAVWRIDSRTGRIERKIHLPSTSAPSGVAFGEGRFWYIDAVAGTLRSVDPATNKVSGGISLFGNPTGLAAGAGAVWVLDRSGGAVYRVPTDGSSGIEKIDVGGDPVAITVGEGAVWVANRGDGTVSEIDPVGVSVVHTVSLGQGLACETIFCAGLIDVAAGAGGVWVAVGIGSRT
jgi:serine/threonine protein kinase/DNA-binding beta-propeller fold protein YncE